MNIDYVEEPFKVDKQLNINPEVGNEKIKLIKVLYDFDYIRKKESCTEKLNFEMEIVLKHKQPISFRPRRLAFSEKEKLRVIIDDLLERGLIRSSNSPYASPILLRPKKSGELRLVIDYRELNKITIKDNYPCQLIDDNLDQLREKHFFTSLDLKDGYHHVKMADNSIKYTAFVTPLGHYEYSCMSFRVNECTKSFC